MQAKIKYTFSCKLWQHKATGGWVFVSLPKDISSEIREHLQFQEEGWGRMKAEAKIGNTKWDTAIWYDTKAKAYLLPIKSEVRKKEQLVLGVEVKVELFL